MNKISTVFMNEIEYVIIDRGNEEYTSMPKSIYDAQQAAAKPVE